MNMTKLELLNAVQEAKKEIKVNLYQEIYLSHYIAYRFDGDVKEFFFGLAIQLENEYLSGAISKTKFSKWLHTFDNIEAFICR